MKEKEAEREWPRGKREEKKEASPRLSGGVFRRICHQRWAKKTTRPQVFGAEEACGKFKTYKTYKQTNFFPRRRSYRAAITAMSVSRITRCQMPIIFTRRWQLRCAALGRAPRDEEGAISAAEGRRSILQFRRKRRQRESPRRRWVDQIAKCARYNSSILIIDN